MRFIPLLIWTIVHQVCEKPHIRYFVKDNLGCSVVTKKRSRYRSVKKNSVSYVKVDDKYLSQHLAEYLGKGML